MADRSTIEWTDATWNPITGCSIVSAGCTNCYAMRLAGTRLRNHPSRAGLTDLTKAGPVWNGQVRLNTRWLDLPLRWMQPRRIFVCAHGDLFAEDVPDAWIDQVFAVMALCSQHTFQVLTKRAERMEAYLTALGTPARIAADGLRAATQSFPAREALIFDATWPLPNVWLGVSTEHRVAASQRVPRLLRSPAAVRYVSAEPLIGPIDFTGLPAGDGVHGRDALTGKAFLIEGAYPAVPMPPDGPRLDWVIVGGESGPGARHMMPDWVRQIRDACEAASVPLFFKQWGAWGPVFSDGEGFAPQDLPDDAFGARVYARLDPLKVRETVARVGKKRAGRLLDGVEHNGFPEVRA